MSDTKKNRSVLPANWGRGMLLATATLLLAACSDGATVETAQCSASGERAAALAPLARGDVAAFSVADEPVPLPVFEIAGKDGSKASTADFAGRTVLLNLWATWCAPCREEMPALDKLQADLGGETFQVLPVSIDRGGPEKPLAFYEEIGVSHLPFYQDETMGIFNELKKKSLAFGLPVTLLIDKDGCVLGNLNGPADWAGGDAKQLVGAALGQ